MTPDQALLVIQDWARFPHAIHFTPHAVQRMRQRYVKKSDVLHALRNADSCEPAVQGRWKVTGPDEDADDLTVIVFFDFDLLVITVY